MALNIKNHISLRNPKSEKSYQKIRMCFLIYYCNLWQLVCFLTFFFRLKDFVMVYCRSGFSRPNILPAGKVWCPRVSLLKIAMGFLLETSGLRDQGLTPSFRVMVGVGRQGRNRKNSDRCPSCNSATLKSYDQKTEQVTEFPEFEPERRLSGSPETSRKSSQFDLSELLSAIQAPFKRCLKLCRVIRRAAYRCRPLTGSNSGKNKNMGSRCFMYFSSNK